MVRVRNSCRFLEQKIFLKKNTEGEVGTVHPDDPSRRATAETEPEQIYRGGEYKRYA